MSDSLIPSLTAPLSFLAFFSLCSLQEVTKYPLCFIPSCFFFSSLSLSLSLSHTHTHTKPCFIPFELNPKKRTIPLDPLVFTNNIPSLSLSLPLSLSLSHLNSNLKKERSQTPSFAIVCSHIYYPLFLFVHEHYKTVVYSCCFYVTKMASPSELSLDCKPHSYSTLLKSFGDQNDQTQKLEDFLSRLEEERLKIDAFKRELPLCMQLLSNGIIYIHIFLIMHIL